MNKNSKGFLKSIENDFLGMPSIGTYGCCKFPEYKFHLREGLRSFIKEIEPKVILVYGAMPNKVFEEFKNCGIQFFQYDNWTKRQHKKSCADKTYF